MAKPPRSYAVSGLNVNIEDTTPPEPPKPPPPPDYLCNTLIIALIFETILLITFAKGDAAATIPAKQTSQIIADADCMTTRDAVINILVRQRNVALRNAEAERGGLNERAWSLVSDVLDQTRDQVNDLLKWRTAPATLVEPARPTQTKGCIYR